MIYCVGFSEVTAYLEGIGLKEAGRVERHVIFRGAGNELLILREPNENGHLPEMLVNDAFDAARIPPPQWNVFWCD